MTHVIIAGRGSCNSPYSKLQEQIDNVQTIAVNAKNTADNAQDTADIAISRVTDDISTINNIQPDQNRDFKIAPGSNITVTPIANGISISTPSIDRMETINNIQPDQNKNFKITAGVNVTITPETNGIKISAINGAVPDIYTKAETDSLLDDKQDVLTAGTGISIVNDVISATPVSSDFTLLDRSEWLKMDYNTNTGYYDLSAILKVKDGYVVAKKDFYLSFASLYEYGQMQYFPKGFIFNSSNAGFDLLTKNITYFDVVMNGGIPEVNYVERICKAHFYTNNSNPDISHLDTCDLATFNMTVYNYSQPPSFIPDMADIRTETDMMWFGGIWDDIFYKP